MFRFKVKRLSLVNVRFNLDGNSVGHVAKGHQSSFSWILGGMSVRLRILDGYLPACTPVVHRIV